jgi:hypothetical protein
MFFLPIAWAAIYWLSGVERFEGQNPDLILGLLVSAQTLGVGFDRDSFLLGPACIHSSYINVTGSTSITSAVAPHFRSSANCLARRNNSLSASRLAALIRN